MPRRKHTKGRSKLPSPGAAPPAKNGVVYGILCKPQNGDAVSPFLGVTGERTAEERERFRRMIEEALHWPAGTCAKLRELHEAREAAERSRNEARHKAARDALLEEIARLTGVRRGGAQSPIVSNRATSQAVVASNDNIAKSEARGLSRTKG